VGVTDWPLWFTFTSVSSPPTSSSWSMSARRDIPSVLKRCCAALPCCWCAVPRWPL